MNMDFGVSLAMGFGAILLFAGLQARLGPEALSAIVIGATTVTTTYRILKSRSNSENVEEKLDKILRKLDE